MKRIFSLRVKLAMVSVLLLAIPLIGFWYAAQMQSYLLFAQEQALSLTARNVLTILYENLDVFEGNILQSFEEQREIHAYPINNEISLDGFPDDWNELLGLARYYGFDNVLEYDRIYEDDTLNFKHLIAKRGKYYYVMFMVNDDSVVYRERGYKGLDRSDHLRIAVLRRYEDQPDLYFLSPYENSEVYGYLMRRESQDYVPERPEQEIHGYWLKTKNGYNIEIRLPVAMVENGRISFAIADVDDPKTGRINAIVGTGDIKQSSGLGFLLAPSPILENTMSKLHNPSARIRIIDERLRQRASVGQYYGEPDQFRIENDFSWNSLLKPVYAFFSDRYKEVHSQDLRYLTPVEDQDIQRLIRKGEPFTFRLSLKDSGGQVLIAGEPIKYANKVIGTVLAEQATNNILTEKNRIIEKTVNITLIVMILGGIVLVVFASRLSGRISRLASQAKTAVGPDGRIQDIFKASDVQDELGDLSRRFAVMLKELKDYSTYLEKMADTLEHEIRTPVAGISASIINLEKRIATADVDVQNHLSGIKENLGRIDSIMTSIREATQLKDALKQDEQVDFDLKEALAAWVKDGYRQTFSDIGFVLKIPEEPVPAHGDPRRIRQMLDKIIENAADFSRAGKPVTIELTRGNLQALVRVSNEGPELPGKLQGRIFDSMVSMRKNSHKKSHLGLGLFVARTIAEFHGGMICAENRNDGITGAVFIISLPYPGVQPCKTG